MNRLFVLVFGALVFVSAGVRAEEGRYVRKMLEPDFFIPEEDKFFQQEKLPPVYLNGKNITDPTTRKSAEKESVAGREANQEEKNDNELSVKHGVQAKTNTGIEPAYRQKYDAYHQDLENITDDGDIPANSALDAALREMNSEDVFKVKKAPSADSEVKIRFEKAVEKTLEENG